QPERESPFANERDGEDQRERIEHEVADDDDGRSDRSTSTGLIWGVDAVLHIERIHLVMNGESAERGVEHRKTAEDEQNDARDHVAGAQRSYAVGRVVAVIAVGLLSSGRRLRGRRRSLRWL